MTIETVWITPETISYKHFADIFNQLKNIYYARCVFVPRPTPNSLAIL